MFPMAHIHLLTRILPLTVLIVSLAVFVLFVVEDPVEREPVSLTGVYMPDLEMEIRRFLSPADDEPQITASDARARAERWEDPGRDVRETILAYFVSNDGASERLVWVINYDPSSVPVQEPASAYTLYEVAVVDAESGEYLFTQGGSGSCDKPPDHSEYALVIDEACG